MTPVGRDYDRARGGGRFRDTLARIFGDADNPLNWALPMGQVAGIRIRVHIFFVLYVLIQLIVSISLTKMGFGFMAMAMSALFVLVLLHEFGHCFACRAVGGEADQILMWPLGGLASCAPPHTWRANFITTAGGPAVNVAIAPITFAALVLLGYGDVAVFNPFAPGTSVGALDSWWIVGLWWTHYLNLLLLAFNVLVPMFPMDGGRLMQALLWRSMGYRHATEITIIIGFVGAGVLAIIGLAANEAMLLGIAIFGAVMCWRERTMLRAESDMAYLGVGAGDGPGRGESGEAFIERKRREVEKRRAREAKEQAELDRILAKIADTGMGSLTWGEKKALRRATDKRRRG